MDGWMGGMEMADDSSGRSKGAGELAREGYNQLPQLRTEVKHFDTVQGSTMRPFPGLMNLFPAVAYHLCLNLPAGISQPGNGSMENPCTVLGTRLNQDARSHNLAFRTLAA